MPPFLWVAWLVAHGRLDRLGAAWVMGVALVLRAAVLPLPPTLSDDIHRYVWDGRVAAAGIDPYAHPPIAQALAHLRDGEVWPRINHPYLRTIYPPVAQAVFHGLARLGLGVQGFKVAAVAADLGAAWLLVLMLRRRGRPAAWATLYAWHPLVVVETASSGHMDPLAWLTMLLALHLADAPSGRSRAGAAVALAASAGTKLLPAVLWPFLARRQPWAWVLVPAALLALAGPHAASAGARMGESLETYGRIWQANAGAYALIEAAVESLGLAGAGPPWEQAEAARRIGRAVAVAAFLGALGVAWLRRAGPVEAAAVAVGAFVVLSPTVHPWYVAWCAVLLPLRPRASWLLLTALAPLVYLDPPAPGGAGCPAGWSAWALWVGFGAAWAVERWRARHGPSA